MKICIMYIFLSKSLEMLEIAHFTSVQTGQTGTTLKYTVNREIRPKRGAACGRRVWCQRAENRYSDQARGAFRPRR